MMRQREPSEEQELLMSGKFHGRRACIFGKAWGGFPEVRDLDFSNSLQVVENTGKQTNLF